MDFDAIVLAGGAGARLGGVDKAGLEVGGVRLLDRVLMACSAAGRTVVVGEPRPLDRALTRPIEWTREQPAGGGPVAALAAGMALLGGSAPAPAVLVLATDLPRLDTASVARLVSALDHAMASGEAAPDGVIFVDGAGHRQPLAALYRAEPLARALRQAQPVSGRPMRAILAVLDLVPVPDLGAAADCDTPEQLRSARATAAAQHEPRAEWAQARALAHASAQPGPPVLLDLDQAAGHLLARDLVALVPLPPFDTCAMDGWAVCGPGPWQVSGRLLPGRPASSQPPLRPGQACVVSTGSVVPAGAHGLLRSEFATASSGWLRASPGRIADLSDVRVHAAEAISGDVLVPRGTRITPPVAGLAASAGHDQVLVARRPSVSVLVLGTELLTAGRPGDGRIRDGLGVQLPGWVTAGGGGATHVRRLEDDPAVLIAALTEAAGDKDSGADILVTTGGSAKGAGDHVRTALAGLDAQVLIDGVQVRPGGPMQLARLPGGVLVVALPGNPLAALAGVVTLLWPVLAAQSGGALPALPEAVAVQAIPGPQRGTALVPVQQAGRLGEVAPTGHQGSAMLRGVATASALAVVPAGGVLPGARVELCPLPWA